MAGAEFPLACAALFVVAVLYSAVGHAGASGYIAVLTLFGYSAQAIRPISLVLNILVATIGTVQFARAGHFRWTLFWPFAALAVPLAFVGGYVTLPTHWLKVLIGVVLLQRSEGGGLGIGTSQGMGAFMSGRGTANLLTRTTAILAGIFFILSLTLALLNRGSTAPGSSLLDTPPTATQPAEPAKPSVPTN